MSASHQNGTTHTFARRSIDLPLPTSGTEDGITGVVGRKSVGSVFSSFPLPAIFRQRPSAQTDGNILYPPRASPAVSDNSFTPRNSLDESRAQRSLTNPDYDQILRGLSAQPDGMLQRRSSTKSANEPLVSVPRLGDHQIPKSTLPLESNYVQQGLNGANQRTYGLSPESLWSGPGAPASGAQEWDGLSRSTGYHDPSRDSLDSVTTLNSTVSDATPTTPRRSFTMPLASFARRFLTDKDLEMEYSSPRAKPPPAPISISSPTDSAPLTPQSSTELVDGVRRTLGMLDLDESRTTIKRAFEDPITRRSPMATGFLGSVSVPAGLSSLSEDSSSSSGPYHQNYPSRTLSFATPARSSAVGTPSGTGGMTRSVSASSVTSMQTKRYPEESVPVEYATGGYTKQDPVLQGRTPVKASVNGGYPSGTSFNSSSGTSGWTSSETQGPPVVQQQPISQIGDFDHTQYPAQRQGAYSPMPERAVPLPAYQGVPDQGWMYEMPAYQGYSNPLEYQISRHAPGAEYGYHTPPHSSPSGMWTVSGTPVYRELSPVAVPRPGTFFPLMPSPRPSYLAPGPYGSHGLGPHTYLTPVGMDRDPNGASREHSIPSRTLWVGNLDPNAVVADLIRIFSQFGSIESVRILPERECAFINFARAEMAMRARREMEGAIIGSMQIRLGYGKTPEVSPVAVPHPVSPGPNIVPAPRSASHLGHSRVDEDPERVTAKSIWIGNLSPTVTPTDLETAFSRFGPIESARVLAHKNCGFVNFERPEDAMEARRGMHGKDFKGCVIRISYAKVPLNRDGQDGLHDFASIDGRVSPLIPSELDTNGVANRFANSRLTVPDTATHFAGGPAGGLTSEQPEGASSFYATSIPPLPEPRPGWRIDQARLRDMRKRLEGHVTLREIEAMFNECLDEAVELCTDYIGNVVVQRLLDSTSEYHRLQFIQKISLHMAAIGIHKNGTWVVQKIIDEAQALPQIQAVTKALRRHTPPLLLDQFGNYVVQCCLKFGPTHNQFIFDAIVARCVEIGTGRFGARAIRACLESQHIVSHQQKQIAVALVHNVLSLCTNPNGALLISWLLDSSNLTGRYTVVAPRVVTEVARLCCHKMGSAMILKLVNQRMEPEARKVVVDKLFGSQEAEGALEQVLADFQYGVPTVQKILSSACVDAHERVLLADRTRVALSQIGTDVGRQRAVGYKRLLDELAVIPVGSTEGAEAARNLIGYGVVAGTQYLTERGMLIPLDFGGLQGASASQWSSGIPKVEITGFTSPAAEFANGHGENGGHAGISENDLRDFELGNSVSGGI
ncbi:hypothetical protein M427DRAFT_65672 [Gonapodya prolifera JEL478]|uniref:ARM repeat-containing protein n=1 Tax=Gonapodya prolifera (strain JEL478) TaxID=1344416 RepID=A0A139AYB0_GONPJ|nr:hypothetical protein M427DRAFT_65672 [Gonapodya prolifera JEL478]|eukprot:KXS21700.1 hypothetical protein M427DRAFT_65672 [Gonapodya prolifera JEL478]